MKELAIATTLLTAVITSPASAQGIEVFTNGSRPTGKGPAETFTGAPGKYVEIKDTVASFKEIVDGKCDDLPEQAFYMQGGIDDVRAKAEQLKKES